MTELIKSKEPCQDCGELFMRPKQRGRPPKRCTSCKMKHDTVQNPVEINEELLYRGPKSELQGNKDHRPYGTKSAQCPICWRVFVSDNACESHKDYRTTEICRDPATLGMIAIDRKGIPVWKKPMEQETADLLYGG